MVRLIIWLGLLFALSSTIHSKELLILHSYHKGYKWSDDISLAIENSLRTYKDLEITTEYMDTKRVYSYEYIQEYLQFFKTKYKNRKFDAIIASDDNAYHFLLDYLDQVSPATPVLFCGINYFNKHYFQSKENSKFMSGVLEKTDIKKNIELILKIEPELENLVILNDTTITGRAMKKSVNEVLPFFEHQISIDYIDTFEIESLKKTVSELPPNSAILFLLLFRDQTGKVFTYKQSLEEISKISKVPIFGLWDFYLEHGIVGGLLTSATEQGKVVADMAKAVLKGKAIKNIPIIEDSPNKYIFNYHKLKEFNIKRSLLPKYSTIINKPVSFFDSHKEIIWVSFLIIMVLSFIIANMFINIKEKEKAENKLNEQLKFIEVLLDTIKQPIVYKDLNGKYQGFNIAFSKMVGIDKKDLIGKTVFDCFNEKFSMEQMEKEREILENKSFLDYESVFIDKNGKEKNVLINKSVFYNAQGYVVGTVSVINDITERKKDAMLIKQNESFLAQQSKLAEVGEMISAIAHQWNEPLVELSAIIQDIQMSYEIKELSKEDMHRFVEESMVQIQYMSSTLRDFRDFLKPSITKDNFDIKEALDAVYEIVARQIKYSYISLNTHFSKDQIFNVYGYKNEFKQVLLNIINNAKDAILKKKKTYLDLNGEINISVSKIDNFVKIDIEDNGIGIDAIQKDKIFDPYYTTKQKGTGIGLYMSKVLIEDKMDGKIDVFCTQKSTKMVILLPKGKQ